MKANEELQQTLEAEGFITVARAEALLAGLRRQTIYGWVEQDHVKCRRVGGLLFVAKADVVAMLNRKRPR